MKCLGKKKFTGLWIVVFSCTRPCQVWGVTRLANPPNIDKAIEEANKYYNGQLEVMTLKFIKKCLRPLWNIIRKFWTAILLFIMAFQVYCSVYGCARNCKKSN